MNKNTTNTFVKQLPANIFAGFVVSLIALPLGLGLALASGAPPIAGIISAVVGGFIVSILGGTHVTIAGPGNGLVVAVLSSITILGAGDMYQGYLYTLAAIIISGAVIVLLAFLNLGKLSDFFPSAAIQGMLAAIGIIILAKQFHIMVGNLDAVGSPIELLLTIPVSLIDVLSNPEIRAAALVGICSLLIMAFYPKIRNKYFQLLPAPMWIVLLSVGLSYYFETTAGITNPIPERFFVSIPDNLLTNFPTPDFSKIGDIDFIMATFTITMIASIESLLSIKAVDKLDPKRRRSNVNKGLRALGIATIASGFLGGLNVVKVIARSSVNVNNNATNRSANFFHALFLLLFILLFKEQLQHISYPALAAILVYTGYKLASPETIAKIASVGKMQLLIFFLTLFTTLLTSLIIGIVTGIAATFIAHIILTKNVRLFFQNIKVQNVSIKEEADGKVNVKVKHFASFANFFRLKKVLDSIEPNQKVVVDMRECSFVDDTVMESLWDYEQIFDKHNGELQVIGLDLHDAESHHPFAFRRMLRFMPFVERSESPLTQRQQGITDYMQHLEWSYNPNNDYHMYFIRNFIYFRVRQVDHIYNLATNEKETIKSFDIEYSEGSFIAEEELHASMVYVRAQPDTPAFTLDKGDIYERLHYLG
ncbi:MAG: SulP family inorganic anion transporter, partial [Spirosomaceae bacterium]|nr:SulP family inorganic anion transporter [Spirosomataceae bacterium]